MRFGIKTSPHNTCRALVGVVDMAIVYIPPPQRADVVAPIAEALAPLA